MKPKRPLGLLAIIVYKAFIAVLFGATALALLFTVKNYEAIVDFAEPYTLEGKKGIIAWFVEKFLQLNPKTLKFGSLVAAIYGMVTAIEVVGLWQGKGWANILVVALVAISIPPEIYELVAHASWIKALVLAINLVVLTYLVKNFPNHAAKHHTPR